MNTERVDSNLFEGSHYLGKPADFTDKIISRRVELVKQIPDFCNENYSLVEVGCGNGSSMILLSAQFKNILGLEIHEPHKKEFDELKQKFSASNCDFKQFDIENESDRKNMNQKFDRLISFEVIEHFPHEESVKYFADLLNENGLLAISVPNKWWIFETHGAKLPLLPWNRVPFFSWLPRSIHERFANARIYTKNRIKKLLEQSGFEVLEMKYITAPMDVLKEGKLKRWLLKNIFKNDTTSSPFKSTSIFVVARKK